MKNMVLRMFKKQKDFDLKRLKKAVPGDFFYYDTTSSTNVEAKNKSNIKDKSVFLAREQLSGRGRLGRSWNSNAGDGIFMSIVLVPDIPASTISTLTLLSGLAVSRVLEGSRVKWPNDVLFNDKKVSGILTEMVMIDNNPDRIIVGIGVNVGNKSFPCELLDKATSLYLETGKIYDKTDIIIKILNEFFSMYDIFLKDGVSALRGELKEKCVTLGKTVVVERSGEKIVARAVDITDNGELLIEKDGEKIALASGEVSVRGLLGYN